MISQFKNQMNNRYVRRSKSKKIIFLEEVCARKLRKENQNKNSGKQAQRLAQIRLQIASLYRISGKLADCVRVWIRSLLRVAIHLYTSSCQTQLTVVEERSVTRSLAFERSQVRDKRPVSCDRCRKHTHLTPLASAALPLAICCAYITSLGWAFLHSTLFLFIS
ncbi:hypothetical protein BpHYR1_033341 [Brachionus plicatilis]|uniref:Uncharacterized protein n=1 Tax=Brachionus plicatilis TaxID=10195 RepID=A0A3M7PDV7_BRAPC|nr:hypothetical protein BpHYR1_033341 [Brachionus plicatilis]